MQWVFGFIGNGWSCIIGHSAVFKHKFQSRRPLVFWFRTYLHKTRFEIRLLFRFRTERKKTFLEGDLAVYTQHWLHGLYMYMYAGGGGRPVLCHDVMMFVACTAVYSVLFVHLCTWSTNYLAGMFWEGTKVAPSQGYSTCFTRPAKSIRLIPLQQNRLLSSPSLHLSHQLFIYIYIYVCIYIYIYIYSRSSLKGLYSEIFLLIFKLN